MSTLQERIAEIMATAGLSVGDIADIAGVSSSAVTQWKEGPTKTIKTAPATRLSEKTGYRAMWIATGDGPKKMQDDGLTSLTPIDLENNPDYPAIQRVRFKLSAGASGFSVEYDKGRGAPIVFQREWFERNGYRPNKLFATDVANGSMEPGLYDGDTVIVNTEQSEPKDGRVFAVNYEGELVIKRLIRDEGQWWLSSDNPDQRRYPRKACHADVHLIGEIIHKQSERL
ncbi:LexA family transcriptional regulator [Comamonas sp. B21-038]|uniref:LexA family transcriptional regulator n=1 Tax=Comamonas sp. B21-038 TaxID=2918299 RepID=UPI001EFB4EAD|nr:LexA family transcriptional regulator [Comamonas sp. B21-038]ULR87204.1 LexA family transcriptional regulator [Comamonas sp. B21-038]